MNLKLLLIIESSVKQFLLLLFMFLVASNLTSAQPGALDLSFSGDGKVIIHVANSDEVAFSACMQNNGKIVVAGSGSNTNILFRFNSDGTLDNTFGLGGKVTTTGYGCHAAGIQSDGKIVTVGASTHFLLLRYNINGSLDNTFGVGGIVRTFFASNYSDAAAVAFQIDGKIIAVGNASIPEDFAIARYNINGSLDSSFGNGGMVITDFGTPSDKAHSVAIQNDGKIVVGGETYGDFALARYNTDGSLDGTFGVGGKVTEFILSCCTATGYSVAIQNDGKIILAGNVESLVYGPAFGLVRFNNDGSLDNTFGQFGHAITYVSTFACCDQCRTIALQADNKIVASGTSAADFALVRYNTNGTVDSTFGIAGIVTTDFSGHYDLSNSVAIQSDGKIVAAGFCKDNNNYTDFCIARYNGDAVDIDEAENKFNELILYPNPTTNTITIKNISSKEKIVVEIINVLGEKVYSITTNEKQKTINLSGAKSDLGGENLPQGIYFVKVSSGEKSVVRKLVVE